MKPSSYKIRPYHIAIIGILFFSFHQAFAINHFKEFDEGRWTFDAEGSYFRSNSNYTSSGSSSSMVDNNYYQLLDTQGGVIWGFTNEMNFYLLGNIASAESKGIDATRSNTSFNKVIGGGEFFLEMGSFHVIPEFQIVFNNEKITNTQDSVLNSEGVNEFTGKLNLQFDFTEFKMFGYGGFTYREGGRSNLFPWGVNLEYAMSKFKLGGEVFGFQSITDDKDKNLANEAVRDTLRARTSAGSARFYSINPSVIDSNAYVIFDMGPQWSMSGSAGMTFMGTNYSNGFHFGVGLRYILGQGKSTKTHRTVSEPVEEDSKISTDKKVEKFKESTDDGVDQSVFKLKPTPKPKTVVPVKKAQPTGISNTQLQNKMDNVEMQIELKANKKKKRRH